MAEYKGVLIFGEVAQGRLAPITLELLGIGRCLADELGEEVMVALLGSGLGNLGAEAIAFGADKVYVVDDPLLKDYQTDPYLAAMETLCRKLCPSILLMGQTAIGRDLAPRLAFSLETGLSMDCINLSIDPDSKRMVQTRPVYGGNALAMYITEAHPQMATVRVKAMSPRERDDARKGEVIPLEAGIDPSVVKAKLVERVKEEAVGIKLEDAKVVVSAGRGIGGPENLKAIEELAAVLGAAVGASRPVTDAGWLPPSYQVGLTGKIVSPDLYVAVGISGAMQHMAGCSGSKNIVAINKDPEANIFKQAHYGVVGDFKKVLPAFTQKCKELLSG